MSNLLFQTALAQTNTAATDTADVGLKKAVGANFVDVILGIPWWFFITLGLILLYIAWVLGERELEEEKES